VTSAADLDLGSVRGTPTVWRAFDSGHPDVFP
jgi:hypothetical protein